MFDQILNSDLKLGKTLEWNMERFMNNIIFFIEKVYKLKEQTNMRLEVSCFYLNQFSKDGSKKKKKFPKTIFFNVFKVKFLHQ